MADQIDRADGGQAEEKDVNEFKPGTRYVSRGGQEVRIYATDGESPCPIHGAIKRNGVWCCRIWTPMGLEYESNHASRDDIVGLWTEPPEPKWRPYTADELPMIVGRRIRHKETGKVFLVVGRADNHVETAWFKVFQQQLFEQWQFLDFDYSGNEVVTPCGVLEGQ